MSEIKLIPTKSKDVLPIKTKIWEMNKGICPILKVPILLDNMALDHIHKLKKEECSVDKGVVRNAIDMRANQLEGLYGKTFKRFMGNDSPIGFTEFLRNLADYIDEGAFIDEVGEDKVSYIHYTEVPKPKKLQKACYAKLKKTYNKKAKLPEFPKSGKLTKGLEKLFNEYNIEIKYYA